MEFLQTFKTIYPGKLENLIEKYDAKLWHELSLHLLELLQDRSIFQGQNALKLYQEFVSSFETKISGANLIQLISAIGIRIGSKETEIFLYRTILEKSNLFSSEIILSLEMCLAFSLVRAQHHTEALAILNQGKEKLSQTSLATSLVFAHYYRALAEYHQAHCNYNDYYSVALLYLSYSDLNEISVEDRTKLAVQIAVAGILSDKVFDFAVFLQSNLLTYLEGEFSWLKGLLYVVNEGNVHAFNLLLVDWQSKVAKVKSFQGQEKAIRAKVEYLSILNAVLRLNPHDRNITFGQLSMICQVEEEQIEGLIMKLMSLKLLRGAIDQVAKVVKVDWIQPRELDDHSISEIAKQLNTWGESVKGTLRTVEECSPELFL